MSGQFTAWGTLLKLSQEHKTKQALRDAIVSAGLKLVEDEPWSGYYRCAAMKGGPLLPVAIWREDGKVMILRDGKEVARERVWPYCAWTPISYEWFEKWETEKKWPDEPPAAVAKPAEEKIDTSDIPEAGKEFFDKAKVRLPDEAPAAGHNNPPVEDEATTIKGQIEAAKGVAEATYAEIDDDDTAAAAQALRSRLLSLSGDADKKRAAEKEPHFEKAKAVDAKWQPVVKLGKAAADWLRDRMSAYETKKANAEAEVRRKQLAEEAKRAEEARKKAEAEGKPVEEAAAETAPVEQTAPPPVQTTIKGATGRAATVRLVKKAKVVDYDKAYAHLKAIPDIKLAIERAAQRQIDLGQEVPGVEVHEERRVA